MNVKKSYPIVLSIAGSDSSGGAGIQADLKTFSALGVYGATAITAITAQNTQGVYAQFALAPQMVYDQIVAVLDDLHPKYVKIGMLSNVEIVVAVAEALRNHSLSIILDPVMVSTSGHRLLSVEAQEMVKQKLLPISLLVTPNIPEMTALTGMSLATNQEKEAAASYLLDYGVGAVLIKGGHEIGATKNDVLFTRYNACMQSTVISSDTVQSNNTHGTGCTLSAAIAAYMARGYVLETAVVEAKKYITEAIRSGAAVQIGHGFGPVNHGFNPQKMIIYETN